MTQQPPSPDARPGGRRSGFAGPQPGRSPVPEPSEFTYRRWSGGDRTVRAAGVTFEPTGHVVFRDHLGRVVLAERQEQVNELKQLDAGEVSS